MPDTARKAARRSADTRACRAETDLGAGARETTRRQECPRGRLRACATLALALGVVALAGAQSASQLALQYYEQAVAAREQLERRPEGQADAAAYQKVVEAFRRVYVTAPESSKADDSLLAIAELWTRMIARFGPAPYRENAVAAYRFLNREYPHSPLGEVARKALAELGAVEAARKGRAETAWELSPPPATEAPGNAAAVRAPVSGRLPQVTGIRHTSLADVTRVIVELEADVRPRSGRLSNPERFFFDLPDTRLSPALKGQTIAVGDALVKQVRVAQKQIGVTRVVLDLHAEVVAAITTEAGTGRVTVEVRKGPVSPATAPGPTAAAPAASAPVAAAIAPVMPASPPPKAAQPDSRGQRNLIRTLGLKLGRVVIDPGHGGHDTGGIGSGGLMEKDLALDVATRLAALVSERLGSEVVLTRTDDTFVSLEDRTALANEKQSDLLLSIHANSSRLRTARGIETYYLSLTGDREAMAVAARENAAANKSIHELEELVSKIALTEKVAESREFAVQVQRALHGSLSRENALLRNRGVRKAPFVVLIGARMPSVLAEISFLSNPRDEKLLRTDAYRQKIAEALYNGVAAYARTLSRMELAAASSQ